MLRNAGPTSPGTGGRHGPEYALVQDIVDFDSEIKLDPSKPDGTPRKLLDTSKINALGWSPRISLKDGISATYDWYRDHGESANN